MPTSDKILDHDLDAAIRQHKALVAADGGLPAAIADNRLQQDRIAPYWAEGAPDMAETCDFTIAGPRGDRAVRLYRPQLTTSRSVILFLHGGGWARGTIATGEWACRALAAESGLVVLSLAYGLAPEHPFPAGLDDVGAALDWLAAEGGALGLDGGRVHVTGTSAGANLALAATLARRDAGRPLPIGLGLLYGVFGDNLDTDSYRDYGPGQYGLSHARMKQYFEWYVPDGTSTRSPLVAPVNADLAELPPIFLGIAEFDVLRDDGFVLAGRLAAAGVATTVRHYRDLAHGYAMFARSVPAARAALSETAAFFRAVATSGAAA